jgi:hypothetical protein
MEAKPEQKHPKRHGEADQIPVEPLPENALDDRVDETSAFAKVK